MDMQPVDSSNIEAIGYDPRAQVLAVRFRSGDTYHYSGVGIRDHEQLMQATSIGGHFHRHIKDRFPFSRR